MRKQMWFGMPRKKLQWVPAPLISSNMTQVGYSESVTFENGGSDARSSNAKHRVYNLSFSAEVGGAEGLRAFEKFASGYYGDDYIYLADPYTFETNILPPHWATPALVREGWPKISPADVSFLETAGNDYDQPGVSVVYDFDSTTFGQVRSPYSATILIPPTHDLHFGASGFSAGSGVVAYGREISELTNRFTNPSFETPNPDVTVALTNLLEYPSMELETGGVPDGWSAFGSATISQTSAEAFAGTHSALVETTAASAGIESDFVTASAGFVYTTAAYVKAEVGKTFRIQISAYDSSDTLLQTGSGPTVTGDGTWQRTLGGIGTPANTAKLKTRVVNMDSGAHDMFVDAYNVFLGGSNVPYFDGDTPEDVNGEIDYRWTGTPNASTSELIVLQPKPQTGETPSYSGSLARRSDKWSSTGSHSLRLTSRSDNSFSFYAPVGTSGLKLGMEVEKTYTLKAKVRLEQTQTGPFLAQSRRLIFAYQTGVGSPFEEFVSDAAPNVPGEHELSLTFTIPANASNGFVGYYHGVPTGDSDVWLDDFLLVEGDYKGEYFDGNNGISSAWTGNENDSTSTTTFEHRYVDLLDPSGATRMNTVISGSDWDHVKIFVTQNSRTEVGQVELTSMMGQLYPTGRTPVLTGDHVHGDGNTGMIFVGEARQEDYVYIDPPRKFTSYTLQEVEAWR